MWQCNGQSGQVWRLGWMMLTCLCRKELNPSHISSFSWHRLLCLLLPCHRLTGTFLLRPQISLSEPPAMLGWLWRPLAAASTMVVSTAAILSTRYERVRLYYHLGLYLTTLGAASVWGLLITVMATATGQVGSANGICRAARLWHFAKAANRTDSSDST